jgi:hypothetical protein
MIRTMLRRWPAQLLMCTLVTTACRTASEATRTGGQWSIRWDSAFADSFGYAAHLDTSRLASSEPAYASVALPESVADFEMACPVGVALRHNGSCLLAIADRRESAVHFFESANRYLGTAFLGGRGYDALSGIGPVAVAGNGRTFVGELGRRRLASIDSTRQHVRRFQSDSITGSMPPLPSGIPFGPDRLIENWMTPSLPVASSTWAGERLPLLRVIDTLGHPVGGLWRVVVSQVACSLIS